MPKYTLPLEDLLRGHKVGPVPEDMIVVGVTMLMKMMGADGESCWMVRNTSDFSTVELIGAHTVEIERLKADFLSGWEREDED